MTSRQTTSSKVGRTAAGGAILSLGAALVGPVDPAGAAALVVTNGNDSGAGSLRDAIATANGNGEVDVITFSPGVNGITLTSGEIAITNGLTINGAGAVTIDANGNDRIFYINSSAAVTISGVTLTGGSTSGDGGAIDAVNTDLTVIDSTITGNSSQQDGGGIQFYYGDLTITDSTFTDNYAYNTGGALNVDESDSLTITGSTFADNTAEYNDGGAFESHTYGDVLITSSSFTGNTSGDIGGGAEINADGGSVTITDSTFTGNVAEDDGGALEIDVDRGNISITRTTITGNTSGDIGGGAELDASDYYSGGGGGDITITDSTFADNIGYDDGGGAELDADGAVTITRTTVTGNTSGDVGGGMEISADEGLTITDSTISGNSAADDGGGMEIYSQAGTTIDRSTISGNDTAYSGGGIDVTGSLTITSSTISGNEAGYFGGAISHFSSSYYTDGNDVLIAHSTIADNTAADGGGGLWFDSSHGAPYYGPGSPLETTITVGHTILSGNASDEIEASAGVDLTVTAANSLIEGALVGATFDDQGGNLLGESAQLLPLANNGGPTHTHALAATSPALDGGDPGFAPPPATDQRGLARVGGEAIDIGAYETQDPVDPVDPVDPTPPPGAQPVVAAPTFTG